MANNDGTDLKAASEVGESVATAGAATSSLPSSNSRLHRALDMSAADKKLLSRVSRWQ